MLSLHLLVIHQPHVHGMPPVSAPLPGQPQGPGPMASNLLQRQLQQPMRMPSPVHGQPGSPQQHMPPPGQPQMHPGIPPPPQQSPHPGLPPPHMQHPGVRYQHVGGPGPGPGPGPGVMQHHGQPDWGAAGQQPRGVPPPNYPPPGAPVPMRMNFARPGPGGPPVSVAPGQPPMGYQMRQLLRPGSCWE
jgi:hypothetical protein